MWTKVVLKRSLRNSMIRVFLQIHPTCHPQISTTRDPGFGSDNSHDSCPWACRLVFHVPLPTVTLSSSSALAGSIASGIRVMFHFSVSFLVCFFLLTLFRVIVTHLHTHTHTSAHTVHLPEVLPYSPWASRGLQTGVSPPWPRACARK